MRPALAAFLIATVVAACGDDGGGSPDAGNVPVANPAREIIDTQLSFDVTALTGTATITFGASTTPGATLEVGDLMISSVTVPHTVDATAKTMDLALPASASESTVEVTFSYTYKNNFNGASMVGYTLLWPYYCGNLFPCHSAPSDGTTFGLALTGVPPGKTAVYPTTISNQAPSYQIAWSVADLTEVNVGTTSAGTQLSIWHLPNQATAATQGSTNLVAAFNWMETTLGAYRFGPKAGGVSVAWGAGALGGMEHHPYWHVASSALGIEEVNIHEAAHGWYGDGIRIQCWEDFVLSEGTTTYLAARALDVVQPSAALWTQYAQELVGIQGTDKVWPQSCNSIDILDDNLFTNAPYIRGAFFYKGIADRLTMNGGDGPAMLDAVLAAFYAEHAGGSATMQQMLDKIQAMTGYDPTACADAWLKSTTKPAVGPCP